MPLRERELIERIRYLSSAHKGSALQSLRVGIGDDCAILDVPKGHELLVTTDLSIEGIHFRREWHPAHTVGHRCLARGLSDIAAMGATPLAAFLSIALPPALSQRWVHALLAGLLQLARAHHITLAGGDISSSPSLISIDVMVAGSAPKGTSVLRKGAKTGDLVYVTGQLGGSAATLRQLLESQILQSQLLQSKSARGFSRRKAFRPHFYPLPRLEVGQYLRVNKIPSAMIDISDGLSTDLAHLCEESGVAASIEADRIPISQIARDSGNGLELALNGGEDYELLFTSSKPVPGRIGGVEITEIGKIKSDRTATMLVDGSGRRRRLRSLGWQHFVNRPRVTGP